MEEVKDERGNKDMCIPFYDNCQHSESGWCLECVAKWYERNSMEREAMMVVVNAARLVFDAGKESENLPPIPWTGKMLDLKNAIHTFYRVEIKDEKDRWIEGRFEE